MTAYHASGAYVKRPDGPAGTGAAGTRPTPRKEASIVKSIFPTGREARGG
jgi:hypothetical protein